MSRKFLKVIIPSALAILLIACASGATARMIHNFENVPIKVTNPTYDLSDVSKAIRRAGNELRWEMREEMPGHIVGTFDTGKHAAAVDITYTLDEYSIHFRSSRNLYYDGDCIHRTYNAWVQYLAVAIDAHLITL